MILSYTNSLLYAVECSALNSQGTFTGTVCHAAGIPAAEDQQHAVAAVEPSTFDEYWHRHGRTCWCKSLSLQFLYQLLLNVLMSSKNSKTPRDGLGTTVKGKQLQVSDGLY